MHARSSRCLSDTRAFTNNCYRSVCVRCFRARKTRSASTSSRSPSATEREPRARIHERKLPTQRLFRSVCHGYCPLPPPLPVAYRTAEARSPFLVSSSVPQAVARAVQAEGTDGTWPVTAQANPTSGPAFPKVASPAPATAGSVAARCDRAPARSAGTDRTRSHGGKSQSRSTRSKACPGLHSHRSL